MDNPFFEKITNKIKKPYYFVPQCPACGSHATARIVKSSSKYNNDWTFKESIKRGEIVKFMPQIPDDYNCVCLDCDAGFYANVQLMMLTGEQIAEQKMLRGTPEMFSEFDAQQKKEKKERDDKRGPIASTIFNSIGHL